MPPIFENETLSAVPSLIPARMINEYAYCPRLAYLEWIEGAFDDNAFTIEGRRVHKKVDGGSGEMPEACADEESDGKGEEETIHARSVMLSAEGEGLIAKIDLVEVEGAAATPVDYKRGALPDNPDGLYDADKVQLCAQGLVLRENGFSSDYGVVYYSASKRRVDVAFDDELIKRTREIAAALREMGRTNEIPLPLNDSPKCGGCSLAGICLPDETSMLTGNEQPPTDGLRRLIPARDDALPLYVQHHGLYVGKKDEELVVKENKEIVARSRLMSTSQVCLFGNIGISADALHECCNRGIPVCHYSGGGWFYGMTHAVGPRNAELKRAQFRAADDNAQCLALARRFVTAKVKNQRTMVRRNNPAPPDDALESLAQSAQDAERAGSLESLLGVEGNAARTYFSAFGGMIKPPGGDEIAFDFNGRNRRPATDPTNALLSFCYALLTKDCTITLMSVGFDPFNGFYHQPRFGRPALALDFMEEFRPIIADSVVLTVVNTGVVRAGDFVRAAKAVSLKPAARKAVIEAYERRMDALATHPVFRYRISYRRILEVQARLMARYICGELDEFPPFLPR